MRLRCIKLVHWSVLYEPFYRHTDLRVFGFLYGAFHFIAGGEGEAARPVA